MLTKLNWIFLSHSNTTDYSPQSLIFYLKLCAFFYLFLNYQKLPLLSDNICKSSFESIKYLTFKPSSTNRHLHSTETETRV